MIVAFEGTPGSGKTYDAVREIVNNLKLGRVVYTNVEGMDLPECQRFLQDFCGLDDLQFKTQFHFLPDSQMCTFWNLKKKVVLGGVDHDVNLIEDGALIVIDEIHKLFSNRNWRSDENQQFANWASTHRHFGFDVYFVTQSLTKIDSHLRSLIEWTYVYRKVNFLGNLSKNRYLKYAFCGDDSNGKPLNTITRSYDLNIFKCYKSMVNDTNVKLSIMPQVNILKHPVFFIIPIVLCFFLYMFFSKSSFATGDILGTSKVQKRLETSAQNLQHPAPPAPVVIPPPSGFPAPIQQATFNPVSSVRSSVMVTGSLEISKTLKKYLLSDGRIVTSSRSFTVGSPFKESP